VLLAADLAVRPHRVVICIDEAQAEYRAPFLGYDLLTPGAGPTSWVDPLSAVRPRHLDVGLGCPGSEVASCARLSDMIPRL
jgi:hypothetical protein